VRRRLRQALFGSPVLSIFLWSRLALWVAAVLALATLAWRRFGAPYGVFALVSIAIPLSFPAERFPLLSMSRFGLVVFPLVLALATLGARQRVHEAIVAVSALLLGVAVVQWALWQWVA